MGDVAQSRGLLEAVNLLLTRLAADHAQKEVAKPQETNMEQAKAAGGPTGPKRAAKSVGRNEPCPCGSGKKYKDCCGKN